MRKQPHFFSLTILKLLAGKFSLKITQLFGKFSNAFFFLQKRFKFADVNKKKRKNEESFLFFSKCKRNSSFTQLNIS